MTLLDHFLREEQSYWSMQSLLRKAICKGMWVLLYGSRVIAVSETKDELVRHFNKFTEQMDPRHHLPGAICVRVGEESKIYRIKTCEGNESKEESSTSNEVLLEREF